MEQHQKCILANSTEQIHFWSKRSSLFSYDPLSSMTLSQTCAETRLICCPLRWKLASFKTLCFHKYCRNIEIQSWLYLQKQKTVDTSGQSVLYQFKIQAKTTSVTPLARGRGGLRGGAPRSADGFTQTSRLNGGRWWHDDDGHTRYFLFFWYATSFLGL